MGKAQSKRSVDITTENKDGAATVDTEAGKVGKIEDGEKPQLNGDVKDAETSVSKSPINSILMSSQLSIWEYTSSACEFILKSLCYRLQGEKQEEKKDGETEKTEEAVEKKEEAAEAPKEEAAAADAKSDAVEATEKPAENGDDTEAAAAASAEQTLNESKDAVEGADDAASTPADGKKKKEKSKKRFLSFRSFSFSKKDKSKPKKEENPAETTNGDIEKVPEEVSARFVFVSCGFSGSQILWSKF